MFQHPWVQPWVQLSSKRFPCNIPRRHIRNRQNLVQVRQERVQTWVNIIHRQQLIRQILVWDHRDELVSCFPTILQTNTAKRSHEQRQIMPLELQILLRVKTLHKLKMYGTLT